MTEPGILAGPEGWPAVMVVEEGMREGLQIEDASISVANRVRLLDALSATGLRRIMVGSFVSPRWTPQMAHVDEVVEGFTPAPGVHYTALALNDRGRERLAEHTPPLSPPTVLPATLVHLCDVFVRRNTNRSRADEIASWPAIVETAVAAGADQAQIGVNSAWGSNWLGPFSHQERMQLLSQQYDLWNAAGVSVTRLFLGDPMGWNLPQEVEQDVRDITSRWPSITTLHLHLHNTRGLAPMSIYAVLRALTDRHLVVLDTSVGGMAGCPYCGNGRAATLMPTEDLVHYLAASGYETGVDLAALIDAVEVAEQVVGHRLYGHVSKAGGRPGPGELYPMDLPFIETLEQAQHFRRGAGAYAGASSPWREPITSPMRSI